MEKTKFTLGEAAKATGYVKSKISADIKDGKLSANRETPTGSYQIDASELIRVYGDRFRPLRDENGAETVHENGKENADEHSRTERTPNQNGVLEAELRFLREKMQLVETMKDGEIKQLQARIDDYRRQVDDAHEQRDQAMKMMAEQISVTKQLTDQRAKETAIPMPPPDAPAPVADQPGRRGGFLGLFGRRAG